jgi:hypothetical protein
MNTAQDQSPLNGAASRGKLLSVLRTWVGALTDRKAWLPVSPLLVAFIVFWGAAVHSLGLLVKTIKFWEYLGYGFALAVVVYWVVLAVLIRCLRSAWPAVVFAWLYLFLFALNTAMLYHAGTVLERYYLQIVDWTNWTVYLTKWVYVFLGLLVVNCIWAALSIRRHAATLSRLPLWALTPVLVFLWLAPQLQALGILRPTFVMAKVTQARGVGAWQVGQTDRLRLLADNPLKILARALFSSERPLDRRPVAELARDEGLLKDWGLPLGPRSYPSLGLKPFDQIVVFATESLSLDFLAPYNGRLPADVTPFYASPEIRQVILTNYWTTALPTQLGLLVTYNSHPNAAGLLAGDSELSIIKLLNQQGFHTMFLKSDSEMNLGDGKVFAKMGFQEIAGSETWLKDPRRKPFVVERGLMDRVLYDAVLETMEKYRGQRVFIHVCGQDTHSPNPREDYGSLQYPPTPASIAGLPSPEAREVMRGIFRHDFDIGRAIQAMRERHLLTDRTLVVLTADHNYPQASFLQGIPGFPNAPYTRIPFGLLSGQPLPEAQRDALHTQLDFAPTLAHLLGLPVPAGWWGQSVFLTNEPPPYFVRVQNNLLVSRNGQVQTIALAAPGTAREQGLARLFQSVFCETPPAKSNP